MRSTCLRGVLLVTMALGATLAARPAAALVLAPDSDTTLAPPDDRGWDYVGRRGNASAVYLGDRWVLTAFHVRAGSVALMGQTYQKEPGEGFQIENPPGFGLSLFTDLRMFRLTEDPGLPPLPISVARPPGFSEVTLIGYGKTRTSELKSWNVDAEGNWIEGLGSYGGYELGSSGKRWGTNWIDEAMVLTGNNGDALSLRAGFDWGQTPHEARAAGGDSGGGVFFKNGDHWELAGIMQSISTQPGQPGNVAVYGDVTNIANLTLYRNQILDIMQGGSQGDLDVWQNAENPMDVDRDGVIAPLDVLLVINELNGRQWSNPATGILPAELPNVALTAFIDVDGDGFATPSDALRVINELNVRSPLTQTAMAKATRPTAFVPEPASWLLALLAVLALWRTRGVSLARLHDPHARVQKKTAGQSGF
jgi:hypothetical protein